MDFDGNSKTNEEVRKMSLSKHFFWTFSVLLCALFIRSSGAIMLNAPLYEKVDESILILIGTVGDREVLPGKRKESRKIDENTYLVPVATIDGFIVPIKVEKVEEILLDRREAKEKVGEKLPKVTIFETFPGSVTDSPIFTKGEKHLIFLRKAYIDPVVVERHKLDQNHIYEVVFMRTGLYKLSGKFSVFLKRNLQYLQSLKDFIAIKKDINKIQDKKERLKRWQELLKSDNETLKRSAFGEIQKIKDPKIFEMMREFDRKERRADREREWRSNREREK